ncbi:putative quinol monooxygenase [Phyllobacterium lublinensis]|uniref:putative quinol monooxygenase n=1 Tax=Phyllobacterium lublinensis TaxID=2875708 RepID=UPI001CCD4D44|nr:putative quinol monooxygenase [Phyllobacterium sp. 2063]MBZ9653643.1 antibiotic biosynthesis monooxygenase [Phyllobacterium sp. 2063]
MTQSPTKITAILTAHLSKAAELRALLVGMAPLCRAEPGNLRWDVWRDLAHGERYVLDELYVDAAAVEAHRMTPHYQSYLAKIPELAERTAWILEAVEVV